MGFWSEFPVGDRFKFVNPGDTIEGEVAKLHATDFGDGPVPVVTIRTKDGDREVTASQRVLMNRLAEAAPEVGDHIRICYDGEADTARPGKSPAKLFTVGVKRDRPSPSNPADVPPTWQPDEEPF